MKALKTTGLPRSSLLKSALVCAALLAAPMAMANQHGDGEGYHGKYRHGDICEKMERGDWEQRREQMREKYNKRHEEIAERLELNEQQRETWDQIRDERRQRYQERYEQIKERCEDDSEA